MYLKKETEMRDKLESESRMANALKTKRQKKNQVT